VKRSKLDIHFSNDNGVVHVPAIFTVSSQGISCANGENRPTGGGLHPGHGVLTSRGSAFTPVW